MTSGRLDFQWVSKVLAAATLFLAGAAVGVGLYFGNLAYVSADNEAALQSAVAGMAGGCAPFEAIAQNRYPPYGAAIRTQPNALSTKVGSYAGNTVISVNGWVYGTTDYPTNPPPWNSNIWFHLTDGAGWVAFPAVRANQMTPDPDGLSPDGGPPVATSKSCEGGIQ